VSASDIVVHYIQGWAEVDLQMWVREMQGLFLYYYLFIIVLFLVLFVLLLFLLIQLL
jgi:hypothetical protein